LRFPPIIFGRTPVYWRELYNRGAICPGQKPDRKSAGENFLFVMGLCGTGRIFERAPVLKSVGFEMPSQRPFIAVECLRDTLQRHTRFLLDEPSDRFADKRYKIVSINIQGWPWRAPLSRDAQALCCSTEVLQLVSEALLSARQCAALEGYFGSLTDNISSCLGDKAGGFPAFNEPRSSHII